MSIKNDIREQIKSAIRHFDFEPMVAELIGDLIDEQLDDIDIEGEVLSALQEEFEG